MLRRVVSFDFLQDDFIYILSNLELSNPGALLCASSREVYLFRGSVGGCEEEFLDAFAGVYFAGVEVAMGVADKLVEPIELAGVAAVVTGLPYEQAGFAADCPDDIVFTIGYQ